MSWNFFNNPASSGHVTHAGLSPPQTAGALETLAQTLAQTAANTREQVECRFQGIYSTVFFF